MDTLSIPLEIVELKADDSGGGREFTAYASTFGNEDHGGDVVIKGAFAQSLKTRSFRPLLWQHDQRTPIGVEKSLREDGRGLLGTWQLLTTGPAEYAYEALKMGAVRAMSIGYLPQQVGFDGDPETGQRRLLKQVDLLENSVVSLPMNDSALVTRVKTNYCPECGTSLQRDERGPEHDDHDDVDDDDDEPVTKTLPELVDTLTFSELVAFMAQVHDHFGEGARKLLATLADGNDLNETKRQELDKLLGTFPGLDAVRADVQRLLAPASEPEPVVAEVKTPIDTALGVRLELRRRQLRAIGVEV